MKTQFSHPQHLVSAALAGLYGFLPSGMPLFGSLAQQYRSEAALPSPAVGISPETLMTKDALAEIAAGNIPDLGKLCLDLHAAIDRPGSSGSALQFVPVLDAMATLKPGAIKRLLNHPKRKHVLVDNKLFKAVLIRWEPGQFSGIHGHPKGGCVFKVLKGKLQEKRYGAGIPHRLLSTGEFFGGSMAYIDDSLAYHAVGNPYEAPAISLHVYTYGKG